MREAAKVGQPPDPFPVFSDERIGNVVRKLRFLIPPSSFVDRLDAVDSTQRVKFYDVCVVDIGSTTDLKRSLSRVVGPEGPLKIRSITSSPFYQPSSEFYLHTFRAADVVVASESFSRVDFVALAAGCLLIKPECSNVLDYCDTYSIRNPNLIYCDPCYRDIEACLNEAFTRKACPKFIDECRAKVEESDWARKFQRLLVDVLDGKERLGSFTKVTPLV